MLSRSRHFSVGTVSRFASTTSLVPRRALASLAPEQQSSAQESIDPNGWARDAPFEPAPWTSPPKTKGTIRALRTTKDGKPATLNFKKGLEHETNFGPSVERVVDLTDLRGLEPQASLAVEGGEWTYAPTALSEDKVLQPEKEDIENFVRSKYFDECSNLVKEKTGASKAVAYNFRHRRIEHDTNLADPFKFSGKPLPNFHMDNDLTTAEVNLRRVLGDEDAERWIGKHWGIVNVWRPVGDVVRQWPLGLVDLRTVKFGRDTSPIFTLNNYKTHFTALRPQTHFKYYYVSNLAPDEALLFVDYDSQHDSERTDDTVVGMAHGAFEDHSAPDKFPRRRSIEVRCLVLYE